MANDVLSKALLIRIAEQLKAGENPGSSRGEYVFLEDIDPGYAHGTAFEALDKAKYEAMKPKPVDIMAETRKMLG